MTQPVFITDETDGKSFSFLQAAGYYNSDNYSGDYRAMQLKAARMREQVFISGQVKAFVENKVFETDNKGHIKVLKTGEPKKLSDESPNSIITTVSNEIFKYQNKAFENEQRIIVNKDKFKAEDGMPYEMRFIGLNQKGQELYLAVAAQIPKSTVSRKALNNIIWALKTYLSKDVSQSRSSCGSTRA